MTTTEKLNVIVTDVTGINLVGLNSYNMALCTQDFDGANKDYVQFRYPNVSNIGIGSPFYQSTVNTKILMKSIPTAVFTSYTDNTNLYLNTNLFYMPYGSSADTSTITGTFETTISNYDNSILAPNGKIYCVPLSGTYILIIDPVTDIADTTSLPLSTVGSKYSSGSLAPNGKIYCAPSQETQVLIIDPMLNTLDTTSVSIPGLQGGGASKWGSSLVTPEGIFYGIPRGDTRVLIVDTNDNSHTMIAVQVDGPGDNYFSGCLGPNGKIYCPPFFGGTHVLIIDALTNVCDTTSIATPSGRVFQSAVLAPNENIYCFPRFSAGSTANFLIINTKTGVADSSSLSIASTPGTALYAGARLAPDGLIYSFPTRTGNVLIFDPNSNVVDTTSLTTFSSSLNCYTTGALAPNGNIYCPPLQTTAVLIIKTGIPIINFNQCFNLINNKGD